MAGSSVRSVSVLGYRILICIGYACLYDRACYGVLKFVMESGAKGCEVIVSGKLRAQRAKAMKFRDGYMISAGDPTRQYVDSAVRHVLLRQGVLGIKVNIVPNTGWLIGTLEQNHV